MSHSRKVVVIAITPTRMEYERIEVYAREFDLRVSCGTCIRNAGGAEMQAAVWHDGEMMRLAVRSSDERRDGAAYSEWAKVGPLKIEVED